MSYTAGAHHVLPAQRELGRRHDGVPQHALHELPEVLRPVVRDEVIHLQAA